MAEVTRCQYVKLQDIIMQMLYNNKLFCVVECQS